MLDRPSVRRGGGRPSMCDQGGRSEDETSKTLPWDRAPAPLVPWSVTSLQECSSLTCQKQAQTWTVVHLTSTRCGVGVLREPLQRSTPTGCFRASRSRCHLRHSRTLRRRKIRSPTLTTGQNRSTDSHQNPHSLTPSAPGHVDSMGCMRPSNTAHRVPSATQK